jgi:hypothetical protein
MREDALSLLKDCLYNCLKASFFERLYYNFNGVTKLSGRVAADVAQCTREMRAARGPLQRELGFNEEACCTLAAERSD